MLKKSEQDHFYQRLGQNIKMVRAQKNIKQETLATYLGFTRNSISNIESGRQKIQIHSLIELAECLQVSIMDLLPDLHLIKSQETSSKLEKKLSHTEIFNDAKTVEKIKDFIRLSTLNTKE
jgi:transcriptional regulator with XRE-family HTH domain